MSAASLLTHIVEVVPSLLAGNGMPQWDSHPVWELLLVVRGTHRLDIEGAGEVWVGEPGDVIMLPPGLLHRGAGKLDRSTAIFVLQWQGWAPVTSWHSLHDEAGRVLLACRWLQQLHMEDVDEGYRNHLLSVILAECERLCSEAVPAPDAMSRLRRDIERLYDNPLDAAALAASMHMSPRHMNRRFKERFGLTPARYLNQVRVEHAVRLVRGTRLPLHAIAKRVGLSSQAHLCRLIQRETGMGVRDLRR